MVAQESSQHLLHCLMWHFDPASPSLPICPHHLPSSLQAERGHGTYGRGAQLLNESTRLIQDALQVRAGMAPCQSTCHAACGATTSWLPHCHLPRPCPGASAAPCLQQLQRTQTFSMMELGMGIGDMGRGFGRQPGDLFMVSRCSRRVRQRRCRRCPPPPCLSTIAALPLACSPCCCSPICWPCCSF
jgi:hypothetical protein